MFPRTPQGEINWQRWGVEGIADELPSYRPNDHPPPYFPPPYSVESSMHNLERVHPSVQEHLLRDISRGPEQGPSTFLHLQTGSRPTEQYDHDLEESDEDEPTMGQLMPFMNFTREEALQPIQNEFASQDTYSEPLVYGESRVAYEHPEPELGPWSESYLNRAASRFKQTPNMKPLARLGIPKSNSYSRH